MATATKIAVGTMKVAQISKAVGDFEIVGREIPTPGVPMSVLTVAERFESPACINSSGRRVE